MIKQLLFAAILCMTCGVTCGAADLFVLFHGEPWASDSYIRDVSGDWRYYREPLSLGAKLGFNLSPAETIYVSSRGIIDGGLVGFANRVSFSGADGVVRANYEYTFFVHGEKYGYLLNKKARQRAWIDVEIPLIGKNSIMRERK